MARTILPCLGLGVATAAATGAVAGLAGATSPELVAVASALGGVAGNFATDLCRLLHRPVTQRLLEGRPAIAENHRVAAALRLAQLAALGAVLDRFDTVWQGDPFLPRREAAQRFGTAGRAFIATETRAAERRRFGRQDSEGDEQALREAVLAKLPTALDQALAARREAGEAPALLEGLAVLRQAVEAAVLEELWLHTATPADGQPPAFLALFADSWFDLFIRDVADRLGKEPDFATIWAAEQTALVKAILAAQDTVLARIEHSQAEQGAMLREVLALVRARGAEQDIPEAAVRAIVERLGGEGIGRDGLVPWLESWIGTAREELARRSNDGAGFEAAQREAQSRFRAGRLREASGAFMEEFAREAQQEAARQAERQTQRLRLLEEAIRYDELALDGAAIVAKLRLMAALEGVGAEALGTWLRDKAAEFHQRGAERGENAALAAAIAILHAALGELPRAHAPLDWAAAQHDLGAALSVLGEREGGAARLEAAVAAYHVALEERTSARVPLDWAETQTGLGVALVMLGARESGTARLEGAVAAHRAALAASPRDQAPLAWAAVQTNLGNALLVLGQRTGAARHLQAAVAAYEAALAERTRERVPQDWAATQVNLASALQALGGTARLEQAVGAYRLALGTLTREQAPLRWATVQHQLATALWLLGQGEGETARLEEAAAAYRAAAEEMTRARSPLQWAVIQANLGNALAALGEREAGTARLAEAVAAYRAALWELTRERVPLDWAGTQSNLGAALQALGRREHGVARLMEADAAWAACLTVAAKAWPAERVSALRGRRAQLQAEIKRRRAG